MIDYSLYFFFGVLILAWPLTSLGIKYIKITKFFALLMLLASLGSLYCGFSLLENWSPSIPSGISNSKASIVVPFIKFWPHLLIFIGFIFSISSILALKDTKSFIKHMKKK